MNEEPKILDGPKIIEETKIAEEENKTDDDKCSICLESLNNKEIGHVEKLICNHKFHADCIIQSLRTNPKCPVCRDDGYDSRVNICNLCFKTIDEEYKAELPCNHAFHPDCIIKALRIYKECPTCGDAGVPHEQRQNMQNLQVPFFPSLANLDNNLRVLLELGRPRPLTMMQKFKLGLKEFINPILRTLNPTSLGNYSVILLYGIASIYIIKSIEKRIK